MAYPAFLGGTPKYNVSLSAIYNIGKKEGNAPPPSISPFQLTFPNTTRNDLSVMKEGISVSKDTALKETTLVFWQKVNQEFLSQISPIFEQFNNIYTFAPEIADATIPLRDSMQLAETITSLYKKSPKEILKNPEVGLSGKVKFLRFRKDPDHERWFAIKRPMSIFTKIFQTKNNIEAPLRYYRNNLEISKKVGNHPNFMKVHGVTVKKIKGGTEEKPYLILEYIEGTSLRNIGSLSASQNQHLLSQLKDALLHLYRLNILPVDANHGNFLITKDYTLKLIDFDAWKEISSSDQHVLGNGLYSIACGFIRGLYKNSEIDPPQPLSNIRTVEELKEDLEQLLKFTAAALDIASDDDLYG